MSGPARRLASGCRGPSMRGWATLTLSLGTFLCSAASADVLLGNLDESDDAGIAVGTPADSPNVEFTQAIRFETGDSERGYNLTSVKAVLADAAASDGVRVRIFGARSNGTPYLSLYTLTNPTIADGTATFTAPPSATVRKGARYFVVFDSTASGAGNDYEVRGTESASLNNQAAGWSLNADRHARNKDSASWTTDSAVPLVEINGDIVVQATDANLSELSIDDGVQRFTTLLSQSFDPSMTEYTSSASSVVDRITIEATANNADGASVAFLDGNDERLTDADAVEEGFQVDLAVGETKINVKVTAADGSTTRTYTLTVTRAAPLASADALLSNLDETFSRVRFIGTADGFVFAQGFLTGDNEAGYTLESVKIIVTYIDASAGARVRIFDSTAEGLPNESIHSLGRAPNTIGVRTFEAPPNAVLEHATRYFVVIDSTASSPNKSYKIRMTSSDFLNRVASGWSLDEDRYVHTVDRDWYQEHRVPLLEINGAAVAASSDATLSGLGLTWADGGTETGIALSPPFSETASAYAAGLARAVDRITIAGTKSDDAAVVTYRDGADSALADADSNATGFQIDLDLGVNTIKVHVTAEDGETTAAYTVTVGRGLAAPVWSTTMTVGDSSGRGFSSLPNPDVGALADDTFEHAGLARRVQIVVATSAGVTFRTRSGGDTFGGLVLEWAGEVLPLDDATRSSNTFTWGQTWLDANASALNAATYETTLPEGDTMPVCLRAAGQSCSPALVGPANHAPAFDDGSGAARSVAENAAAGTAVGALVSASDGDGDTLAYVLAGADAADFTIDGSTGQLRTAAALDHEAGSSRSVTVGVSDGNGGSATMPVTVLVTDVEEPPDVPSSPTVAGASSTSLSVSWSAPANTGRPAVTDYDVRYASGSGAFEDWTHNGATTSATITGLSADTSYQVQVLARNAEGASGWSAAGEGRTQAEATLSAWFEDVPDAHDGATEFALTLKFSARVSTLVRHLRRQRLVVADGTVTGMRRVDKTAEGAAEFTLRIIPAGQNAVAVSLPADGTACAAGGVCTADGGQLAQGADAAVPGPRAKGDVRLVGGRTAQEGRVEVRHDGAWGTVCDDRFTAEEAVAVCRQLGYAGGEARRRAAFGAGTGTVWMDDVRCAVGEVRLADRPFGGWGVHNCRHSEDVGVSCGAASGNSLTSATVWGSALTLRFDRPLDGGSVPSPEDFVVAAGAPERAIPVLSVAVPEGQAVLTLARVVDPAEVVSVSYLPAPMHPLQDASYNPVPALTALPVQHAEQAGPPPEAGSRSAAKVEVLDLSARGLSDLSALAGLADVEVLDLGGNRVDDLWPLTGMAGLEVLDLSDNVVDDLSALASLRHLRVLDLSGNTVSDLSPLAGLTALRRLDLSGNRVADLRPLSELRGLEVLLLDGNRVADLVPLWGLRELAHLSLANNRVADAALLRELRSLRRLDLAGNGLRDVSALGGLANLVWLGVSRNPIVNLSPPGRLTALRWLALDVGGALTVGVSLPADERGPLLLIEAPSEEVPDGL
ncbi:MAG: hypothetical protein F4Y57_01530 [Acidobacteria bacterium]|nr:hypothetical protein [Acidobacteriota bacterium]